MQIRDGFWRLSGVEFQGLARMDPRLPMEFLPKGCSLTLYNIMFTSILCYVASQSASLIMLTISRKALANVWRLKAVAPRECLTFVGLPLRCISLVSHVYVLESIDHRYSLIKGVCSVGSASSLNVDDDLSSSSTAAFRCLRFFSSKLTAIASKIPCRTPVTRYIDHRLQPSQPDLAASVALHMNAPGVWMHIMGILKLPTDFRRQVVWSCGRY